MNNKIFTFWEPCNNIPGYLNLCIKTWKKFLPEYEIVILNYNNIDEWLGYNYFPKELYSDYTLAKQADAIRCAILEKYGGIWLDIDTIILSNDFKRFTKIESDFILFNTHLGVIIAQPHAKILKLWLKELKKRIYVNKLLDYNFKVLREIIRILNKDYIKKIKCWNCLGNGLINKFLEKYDKRIFYSIDRAMCYSLPEFEMMKDKNWEFHSDKKFEKEKQLYSKFYFEYDYSEYILKNSIGVILLHNSRVPEKYKQMSEEEFLKLNNTKSNLLKKILYDTKSKI